jgi:hypothetical protein
MEMQWSVDAKLPVMPGTGDSTIEVSAGAQVMPGPDGGQHIQLSLSSVLAMFRQQLKRSGK